MQLDFVARRGLADHRRHHAGLEAPAALIGVAEKGYLSLKLEAKATPGHSSMPPRRARAAIGSSAAALRRARCAADAGRGARRRAPRCSTPWRPRSAASAAWRCPTCWLFGPVVQGQLEKGASTNAMLRTTTALTIVARRQQGQRVARPRRGGGELPHPARRHAGRRACEHVKRVIGNDAIAVTAVPGASEPSKVAPTSGSGYQAINRTVRELFPDTVVAPGLMIGATDARHFEALSRAGAAASRRCAPNPKTCRVSMAPTSASR